ncbi:hypothetical protein [Streptomyces avidinii]|uniref:Uncharacterized protein n=1 Tax=Streptomyces avidinii TaxID=1895 RepID=A0ABS4L4N5_STRAV|nr:hypothetical protein [Streptomyces avidinii]MBP2037064.1 hypothetical protein [Streptomyces avidinii]GGY94937.1 hypothetical protein GCM10010343_20430 [Streptomyces avidinii]
MMLKPYRLGALLLTLLALPVMLSVPALALTPGAPAAPTGRGHTAAQIGDFLIGFYGEHGPSAQDRETRVSQILKERQQVNEEVDVLLCAHDEPRDISIGPVTVAKTASVGWATVTTHWGSGDTDTFTAYVRLDSNPIRLDDVICAG